MYSVRQFFNDLYCPQLQLLVSLLVFSLPFVQRIPIPATRLGSWDGLRSALALAGLVQYLTILTGKERSPASPGVSNI